MATILCIEDEDYLREDICEELRDNGHQVMSAQDGEEGLSLLQSRQPDLVICDIRMPKMDGYQLLDKVRNSENQFSRIPFLFLTAFGERESMIEGLRKGADDYLTKPVDYDVLHARIDGMLRQIERVTQDIKSENKLMDNDLKRAHAMQRDLLPSAALIDDIDVRIGLKITSVYEACQEVGGDMWGVQLISDHKIMLYMVDFSGHGVGAALNTFRLHAKIESMPIEETPPHLYLAELNKWLCGQLKTDQFATFFVGVIDTAQKLIKYACAGSPPPIHIVNEDTRLEIGVGRGLPLGIQRDSSYEARRFAFQPGDRLFLHSDALSEHGRKAKSQLGTDGVHQMIERQLQKVCDTEEYQDAPFFVAPFLEQTLQPLSDDLTVVCCHWETSKLAD